jgi:hypothetical protein
MTLESRSRLCISCSIFRREIQALQATGKLDLPVDYLNSMLHLVPAKLELHLEQALAEARATEQEVVLAYGDCCSHMEDIGTQPGVRRTEGINCCEIILGHDTYRKLRREGAFFLMPEWALSWRKIFVSQLGLMGPCAKSFMQELHTKLIYLDTGILPVPQIELAEASEFLGLPVDILPVSLEPLLANLQQFLDP